MLKADKVFTYQHDSGNFQLILCDILRTLFPFWSGVRQIVFGCVLQFLVCFTPGLAHVTKYLDRRHRRQNATFQVEGRIERYKIF